MKTFLTYLYRKYVFMPELRILGRPERHSQYLMDHGVGLCDSIDILNGVIMHEEAMLLIRERIKVMESLND